MIGKFVHSWLGHLLMSTDVLLTEWFIELMASIKVWAQANRKVKEAWRVRPCRQLAPIACLEENAPKTLWRPRWDGWLEVRYRGLTDWCLYDAWMQRSPLAPLPDFLVQVSIIPVVRIGSIQQNLYRQGLHGRIPFLVYYLHKIPCKAAMMRFNKEPIS